MAEKSVNNTQTALDPMFFIPDGVEEFVYDEKERNLETVPEEETGDDSFIISEETTNYFDGPDTPDILGVVSQTIRTTATGNQVVDLVLEVEELPGLSKYDFRVTKI